jgi:ketosteroid isomerase-like protein/predicted ester cyclase
MGSAVSADLMRAAIKGSYEALNKRDFDRFGSYLAEGSIDYGTPVPVQGKTAIVGFVKDFFSAFPDYSIDLEDIAISGNKAYVKNTVKGTHSIQLMEMIPPTGRKINWTDVDVMEFDQQGKIVAHWLQNPNAPLDQIGYHALTNSNTALIMDIYNKFSKGDAKGIAALCKDNVVWDVTDNPALKSPKLYTGKKEVPQFFADLMASCDVIKFEPLRFLADGDDVTTIISVEWKNKSNHKVWGTTFMHHFKFEEGKIAAFIELTGKPMGVQLAATK